MNRSPNNELPPAEPNWGEPLERERTSVEARWGTAVAEGGYGSGWTAVPSALIRNIAWFQLRPTEVTVLLSVLMHYWSRDRMPYPRVASLARYLGLSRRTVERTLRSLEERDLIIWEESTDTPYGKRRRIELSPLIEKVDILAAQRVALTQPGIEDFDNIEVIDSIDEEDEFDDDVPF